MKQNDLVMYKYSSHDAEYGVIDVIEDVPHILFEEGPAIPIYMYDKANLTVLAPRSVIADEIGEDDGL